VVVLARSFYNLFHAPGYHRDLVLYFPTLMRGTVNPERQLRTTAEQITNRSKIQTRHLKEYGQYRKYRQVATILVLSEIVNRNRHHYVTNISQVVFTVTVANCAALRVVRSHLCVRRAKETTCITFRT
jgi:hypothetical protein